MYSDKFSHCIQQVEDVSFLDIAPDVVLAKIAKYCSLDAKFVLSAVSARCEEAVSSHTNWRHILLTDDDVSTMGYMFLVGKGHLVHSVVIDQPNLRSGYDMFTQELLTLSTLVNITKVVVQSSHTRTLSCISRMKHLRSLTLAYVPHLSFDTVCDLTRTLFKLVECNLFGLNMSEDDVINIVTQCAERMEILRVSTHVLPDTVANVFNICKCLAIFDFKPGSVQCSAEWTALFTQHGSHKFGSHALAKFQAGGLL